jgi:beta-mannanase
VSPFCARLAAVAVSCVLGATAAGCGVTHIKAGASCHDTPPTSAQAADPRPPAIPKYGAYFGAFTLTGAPTEENLISSFNSLAVQACRPLEIAHTYLRWGTTFPTSSSSTFASHGADVLVSWTGTDTRTIISGAADATITATAREIKAFGWPVFLEFRWEMDRPNLASTVHSPSDYIAAWDRVRRLFTAVGTPNVSWVWCPTAAGFATGHAQLYYPGSNEVDWVCADAYPSTDFGPQQYQPLRRLLRPFLNWAQTQGKPVMIGEFGVPKSYSPGQRTDWLEQARVTLTAGRQIKAVAYFDYDPVGAPPSQNYALGDDPNVLSAFRDLATDPYFRPTESN